MTPDEYRALHAKTRRTPSRTNPATRTVQVSDLSTPDDFTLEQVRTIQRAVPTGHYLEWSRGKCAAPGLGRVWRVQEGELIETKK